MTMRLVSGYRDRDQGLDRKSCQISVGHPGACPRDPGFSTFAGSLEDKTIALEFVAHWVPGIKPGMTVEARLVAAVSRKGGGQMHRG